MSSELINDELSDNGWREVSIADLCLNIYSGGTPKSTEPKYFENGVIPWLKTKEVNYSKITETENFITTDGLKSSSAKLVPVNSVIVAMYGNGDTAGRVAINKIELTTNQACCNLVIDPEKADYRFVYYYLMSQYSKLVDLKNGGAQQNLNSKLIKDFPILTPELAIQREIGAFLEYIDDRITLLRETNATLEAIAQALFKSWFVDFDPVHANVGTQAPSLPAEIQALFPSRLVESPQGLIPEGWEVKTIDDISEILNGFAFKSEDYVQNSDGIFVLRTTNFDDSGYAVKLEKDVYLPESFMQSHAKYLCKPYDFHLVMVGASVGHTSLLLPSLLPALRNQNMWCFRERIGFPSKFFVHEVVKMNVADALRSTSGSAREFFRKGDFGLRRVLVPDNTILEKFEEHVSCFKESVASNTTKIETLTELRDTLLPRLISGQLRLPEAEVALAEVV